VTGKQVSWPLKSAGAVLLAMFGTGCAAEWKWQYQPDPPLQRTPVLANTIAVTDFGERRAPFSASSKHLDLLAMLPGLPYFTREGERPDEAPQGERNFFPNFRPKEAIPRAFADELRNRQIFRSVMSGREGGAADLVVHGWLTTTHWEHTVYLYGLTFYGALLLGLFGAPLNGVTVEVGFTLQLEEPQTQTVLWERSFKKEHDAKVGLYYGWQEGQMRYDAALKELMPSVLTDLEQAIKGMTTGAGEWKGEQ
jgi:hypothetical protein